jgi:hypothetical protein
MAKRKKWSVQKTILIPKVIRDSEFSEILADLGQLIYDELSSQPGSNKSIDSSVATISVVSRASSHNEKESCK